MKRAFTVAFISAVLVTAARADLESGITAYVHGQFNDAAQQFLPLAETANNCVAERFLGEMYAKGKGVEQSAESAAKWYRAAAEQGEAASQYELAALYREGAGVPKDMENAYAWMSVADSLGNKRAKTGLAGFDGQLSADEMANAQKLAAEYKTKYGKSCTKKDESGVSEPIKANDNNGN
jgi:TPR repeat protein